MVAGVFLKRVLTVFLEIIEGGFLKGVCTVLYTIDIFMVNERFSGAKVPLEPASSEGRGGGARRPPPDILGQNMFPI